MSDAPQYPAPAVNIYTDKPARKHDFERWRRHVRLSAYAYMCMQVIRRIFLTANLCPSLLKLSRCKYIAICKCFIFYNVVNLKVISLCNEKYWLYVVIASTLTILDDESPKHNVETVKFMPINAWITMQIYPYNVQIYSCQHIYILSYLRMHVCVCKCKCIYLYTYIRVWLCMYIYTYIEKWFCIYTYLFMHEYVKRIH